MSILTSGLQDTSSIYSKYSSRGKENYEEPFDSGYEMRKEFPSPILEQLEKQYYPSWGSSQCQYQQLPQGYFLFHYHDITRNNRINRIHDSLYVENLSQSTISYLITPDGKYFSINQLVQKALELFGIDTRVDIFYYSFYDYRSNSNYVNRLIDSNGSTYYELFIHAPQSLAHIASILHEIGHIIAQKEIGNIYDLMLETLESDNDWLEAINDYEETTNNWVITKYTPSIDEYRKLLRDYYSSKGARKQQDLQMIEEVDAWSVAISLIDLLGLGDLIDPNSEDLIKYILWAITTRLQQSLFEVEDTQG